VEKLTIGVIDFVDDGGFEIDEDGVRDMLVESGGHRIF